MRKNCWWLGWVWGRYVSSYCYVLGSTVRSRCIDELQMLRFAELCKSMSLMSDKQICVSAGFGPAVAASCRDDGAYTEYWQGTMRQRGGRNHLAETQLALAWRVADSGISERPLLRVKWRQQAPLGLGRQRCEEHHAAHAASELPRRHWLWYMARRVQMRRIVSSAGVATTGNHPEEVMGCHCANANSRRKNFEPKSIKSHRKHHRNSSNS